jgi:hypothetical protein
MRFQLHEMNESKDLMYSMKTVLNNISLYTGNLPGKQSFRYSRHAQRKKDGYVNFLNCSNLVISISKHHFVHFYNSLITYNMKNFGSVA